MDLIKILLAILFAFMIFIPLIHMFTSMNLNSLNNIIHSPNFVKSIINSFVSATLATIVAVTLAYFLALCTERVNIRLKGFFSIVFILPMLIPSISHGMSMVFLFGNSGIVTHMLGLHNGIYGLPGIVLGSAVHSFPLAYLMLSDIMKYENRSPYDAADVLGISKFNQFKTITLPYLRKPLISIIFATFTLIITDYGVPLMIGGKYTTIPVIMYQEVIGRLNFSEGAVYGLILLIPAVIAFIIDLKNKDTGNTNSINIPFIPKNDIKRLIPSYIFCIIIAFFTLFQIISFVFLSVIKKYPSDLTFTWDNFINAFAFKALTYLGNSLLIAVLTSTIGVVLAFMIAYLSARIKSRTSGILHLSAITVAAIPGIVLGISYVLTFKGTLLQGTIIILVMVNIIHFLSSPYLIMYNSLSKLNENLENVGRTLGISRFYVIRDIIIPSSAKTLLEMFSYFFINCMVTISAVSFLATTSNKPVSLMINQFEAQVQIESAVVVSLMILIVNLTEKSIIHLISKKL